MRRFHLSSHFVTPLFSGLADCLTFPHELVPVDTTALVNHFAPPFFLPEPFGLPPSLPFARDDAALRFGVTAPRQVSDEKKDDSLNVLASLTKAGVATGSLVTPSFVGDVTSSCELEQFQQDWFVQSAHADQVPVANLTNLGKVTIAVL